MSEHTKRMESETSTEQVEGRRHFLEHLAAGLGVLAAAAVAVPVIGSWLAPALRRGRPQWIDLGPIGRFPRGRTRTVTFSHPYGRPGDGATGRLAAYVHRRGERDFLVLSPNCTHLGCPVSWFPQSGLFLCPCHGGVYYSDGTRAAGPPPRGLYRYPNKIVRGHLHIRGGHLPTLQNTLARST